VVDGSTSAAGLWELEPIGPNRFLGWCRNGAPNRAFGGQVAAQALAAAGCGLPDSWVPLSLHAHFVREGRGTEPVLYVVAVDEAFREVTALQADKPILTLATTFAPLTEPLPPATVPTPGPTGWHPTDPEDRRWLTDQPNRTRFELRFEGEPSRVAGRRGEIARGQSLWLRTRDRLPDAPRQHACALTYVSDMFLVSTALAALGLPGRRADVQSASLDHAVWFHRPARLDGWVRYEQASPTSAGGRGLSTGRILNAEGALVASVHQEVLLRLRAED
jgi:acyl-CoA thioesterase-2